MQKLRPHFGQFAFATDEHAATNPEATSKSYHDAAFHHEFAAPSSPAKQRMPDSVKLLLLLLEYFLHEI